MYQKSQINTHLIVSRLLANYISIGCVTLTGLHFCFVFVCMCVADVLVWSSSSTIIHTLTVCSAAALAVNTFTETVFFTIFISCHLP